MHHTTKRIRSLRPSMILLALCLLLVLPNANLVGAQGSAENDQPTFRALANSGLIKLAMAANNGSESNGNPPFRTLEVSKMMKWDPIANANQPHVYRIDLTYLSDSQDGNFLIGVVSHGSPTFFPVISVRKDNGDAADICGGLPSEYANTDELISCSVSPSKNNKGHYRFTVTKSDGSAPTTSYAIYAVRLFGLSNVSTTATTTQGNVSAPSVYVHKYSSNAAVSTVSIIIDEVTAGLQLDVRMYNDATTRVCTTGQNCSVLQTSSSYYVVVLVLEGNNNSNGSYDVTLRSIN